MVKGRKALRAMAFSTAGFRRPFAGLLAKALFSHYEVS
jgi:hypothetical protein